MSSYMLSSSIFGSIMIIFTWSGPYRYSSDRIMQLRPTDLPEPVVPATSRWGIGARSAITGSPAIFLPRISGSDMFWSSNAWLPISSDRLTVSRFGLGSSMPMTLRPGIVATRAESADMLRAMSSASAITRLALMPLAGSSSYMVTTGPGPDLDDIAAHVEILEHGLEQAGVALQSGAVDLLAAFLRRRRQQVDRRQLVTVAERQAGLRGDGLAVLAPRAAGATWLAGSATATVGRRLWAARPAAVARRASSVAARGGAALARLAPEQAAQSSSRSSVGQPERKIADAETGERKQQQRREARRARRSADLE